MATTRLGLGGPGAAYLGFAPKAEAAIRRAIGGRLRDVESAHPDLDTVTSRAAGLCDVQGDN